MLVVRPGNTQVLEPFCPTLMTPVVAFLILRAFKEHEGVLKVILVFFYHLRYSILNNHFKIRTTFVESNLHQMGFKLEQ